MCLVQFFQPCTSFTPNAGEGTRLLLGKCVSSFTGRSRPGVLIRKYVNDSQTATA